MSAPTPVEFAALARELIDAGDRDPEAAHHDTDALMERTLRQLGYGEGVDLIAAQQRWYA